MDIDFSELAAFVALLKDADFSTFKYEKGEVSIVVTRGDDGLALSSAAALSSRPAAAAPANAPAPVAAVPAAASPATPTAVPVPATSTASTSAPPASVSEGGHLVSAPMLGTFYAAPKPGEPAFVSVGDRVEPDTVMCIIEVMKLMNSVHAGVSGVVRAVHAGNGELVEFGQPLFSIEQDAG